MNKCEPRTWVQPSKAMSLIEQSQQGQRAQQLVPAGSPQSTVLSPWPVRVIALLALVGIALLAIEVIDNHVMQRATNMSNTKLPTPNGAIP